MISVCKWRITLPVINTLYSSLWKSKNISKTFASSLLSNNMKDEESPLQHALLQFSGHSYLRDESDQSFEGCCCRSLPQLLQLLLPGVLLLSRPSGIAFTREGRGAYLEAKLARFCLRRLLFFIFYLTCYSYLLLPNISSCRLARNIRCMDADIDLYKRPYLVPCSIIQYQ